MRIAIGGICHETSTFTLVKTTIASADERQGYLRGNEIPDRFKGANTPIGGFLEGAKANGFTAVPAVFWEAHPGAPLSRAEFDLLVNDLLSGIADAGNPDGILLELHGSMVAGGVDDAEGHILSAVRELAGESVPIVVQLDIHANVSMRMVEKADVLIGRKTYPEVDMADRGRECANVITKIIRGKLRPCMSLYQIPMVWGMNQITEHLPMREAIEFMQEIEARQSVVSVSIATCYPLADVPDMGASVYVVTDGDLPLARKYAKELGEWIFERRKQWQHHEPTTRESIPPHDADECFPVIFADRYDNTGAGAPGDSTGILRTFVEEGLTEACILYIVDSEAAAQCHEAGVGAKMHLKVGGKSSPLQGEPVPLNGEVIAVSDGQFKYDGPMYEGLEGNMGKSAHFLADGIHVLVVTTREQPYCTAFARSLDLDPKTMRYIGVKSAAHFRSSFEAWAGEIHLVSEPGVHNPAGGALAYENLGRQLYPFDDI